MFLFIRRKGENRREKGQGENRREKGQGENRNTTEEACYLLFLQKQVRQSSVPSIYQT